MARSTVARLVASLVSQPCLDRQGDFICQYLAVSCTLPYIIALYCIFKCHITRYASWLFLWLVGWLVVFMYSCIHGH